MTQVPVVVVDDQTLVREGLVSLLGLTPDLRVVGQASDGDEALRLLESVECAVLLLDVRMPKKSGLQVLEALQDRPRAPAVLLLTTFDDDSVALEGLRLGARGFLLKDVTLEQLSTAVRTLAAGGSLVKPAITTRVQREAGARGITFSSAELPEPLTERELDVLRLLASGASNREIAQALHTAEGTVKNQVSSILQKLGVRDRTRAVLKALELGHL
jgi:DNA-binding NarL/FixJ family response regulator